MNINTVTQIGITIFGMSSMFLVARKNKWGFVVGLISQPFYLYSSWSNGQWGIFFNGIIYTLNWIYGIYNWFIKEEENTILIRREKLWKLIEDYETENICDYGVKCKDCPHDETNIIGGEMENEE